MSELFAGLSNILNHKFIFILDITAIWNFIRFKVRDDGIIDFLDVIHRPAILFEKKM
jgi:hypothetical protein